MTEQLAFNFKEAIPLVWKTPKNKHYYHENSYLTYRAWRNGTPYSNGVFITPAGCVESIVCAVERGFGFKNTLVTYVSRTKDVAYFNDVVFENKHFYFPVENREFIRKKFFINFILSDE